MLVERGEAYVWIRASDIPGATGATRPTDATVGTLDAYYEAHMDLHLGRADLQPLQRRMPISRGTMPLPPAKFVFDEPGRVGRPSTRSSVRRRRLGRDGSEVDHLARACASTRTPR